MKFLCGRQWTDLCEFLCFQMIPGNTNTYTVVEQRLDPPVLATKIRFVPFSEHVRTVCMRVELLGCRWNEGLLSYSMPQGVQRGTEVDLSDRTYDGRDESGYLSGGLGQLVDGQKGQDIFRLDLKGHGKGMNLSYFSFSFLR
ncbi:hypothetical protein L9F63_003297 [Diploptera punctata]|uniref:F5/8 type C domain-containing protein n=1 Tax=Diploptera punctata TaxID=6984 RepID=A0AAD8E9K2_DIPPU|nr:hypothetical protein L9F63_003297 [Diploptera punctata]